MLSFFHCKSKPRFEAQKILELQGGLATPHFIYEDIEGLCDLFMAMTEPRLGPAARSCYLLACSFPPSPLLGCH